MLQAKDFFGDSIIIEPNKIYFYKLNVDYGNEEYILCVSLDEDKNLIKFYKLVEFEDEDDLKIFFEDMEQSDLDTYELITPFGEKFPQFALQKDEENEEDFSYVNGKKWRLINDDRIPVDCESNLFIANFIHRDREYYVFERDEYAYILKNQKPPDMSEDYYALNISNIRCVPLLIKDTISNLENVTTITDIEKLELEEHEHDYVKIYPPKLLGSKTKFYTEGIMSCLFVVIYDPTSKEKIAWHVTVPDLGEEEKWVKENKNALIRIKNTINYLRWNKENLLIHFTRNQEEALSDNEVQIKLIKYILHYLGINMTYKIKLFEHDSNTVGYGIIFIPHSFERDGESLGGVAKGKLSWLSALDISNELTI
tara:strand:- start:614 stop:1717 length:1104 start_codon:yes stop_codon:yes gene_type:complete